MAQPEEKHNEFDIEIDGFPASCSLECTPPRYFNGPKEARFTFTLQQNGKGKLPTPQEVSFIYAPFEKPFKGIMQEISRKAVSYATPALSSDGKKYVATGYVYFEVQEAPDRIFEHFHETYNEMAYHARVMGLTKLMCEEHPSTKALYVQEYHNNAKKQPLDPALAEQLRDDITKAIEGAVNASTDKAPMLHAHIGESGPRLAANIVRTIGERIKEKPLETDGRILLAASIGNVLFAETDWPDEDKRVLTRSMLPLLEKAGLQLEVALSKQKQHSGR
jgi:hypothetical protein